MLASAPSPPYELNRDHPGAQGLVCAVLPGAVMLNPLSAVTGAPTFVTSKIGRTFIQVWGYSPRLDFNVGTVAVHFLITGNTGDYFAPFAFDYFTNGTDNNGWGFQRTPDNQWQVYCRLNTTSSTNLTISDAFPQELLLSMSFTGGGACRAFVNGVNNANFTSDGALAANTLKALTCGGSTISVLRGFVWNHYFTDSQHKTLFANPTDYWGLVQPKRRNLFVFGGEVEPPAGDAARARYMPLLNVA